MSLRRFENKVVLVTASSTGIGFAISERLCTEGATVIISSRSQKNVDAAVKVLKDKNLKAVGFACNVGKKEHRDNLRKFIEKEFGRLDVLIPHAGIGIYYGRMEKTPESAYNKTFDINVKSIFMMVKEYINLLHKGKDANICITSSIGAYRHDYPSLTGIYCVTKTTLLG